MVKKFFEITSVNKSDSTEPLYCIEVDSPSKLFLISKLAIPTHNTDEGKEMDAMKGEIQIIIGSIARLGRAAGVHQVMATQSPYADILPGETKALALHTPILTKNRGWVSVQDITVCDTVMHPSGSWVNVKGVTPVMYGHSCFLLETSHGGKIISDEGHLWKVLNTRTGFTETLTTREMYTNGDTYELPTLSAYDGKEKGLKTWPIGFLLGSKVDNDTLEFSEDGIFSEFTKTVPCELHGDNTYTPASMEQYNKLLNTKGLLLLESYNNRMDFIRGFLDACETRLEDDGSGTVIRMGLDGQHYAKETVELFISIATSCGIIIDVKGNKGVTHITVPATQQMFKSSTKAIELAGKGFNKSDQKVTVTKITPVNSEPVKCISVDSEDGLFCAGTSLTVTHNSNVAGRVACGYVDSSRSSMILGNAEGTKIKGSPKGRIYVQVNGIGDHAQGFFADPEWLSKWMKDNGMNDDGTPLSKSMSRVEKLVQEESPEDYGYFEENKYANKQEEEFYFEDDIQDTPVTDSMVNELNSYKSENPVELNTPKNEDTWDSEMDDLMRLNDN